MYRDRKYLKEEYIRKGRSQANIAREWGIDPKLLHYYIKKNNLVGIKSRIKYSCDETKFKLTDPIFNYYAGLIATDGYIDIPNSRVSLRMRDEGVEEVLTNIKDYFNFTGEIRCYNGNYDLTITSKKLIQTLGVFNIYGKGKTYKLKFPKIFSTSEECQRMYMRGVLDGDGNIKIRKSEYTGKYIGGQFRVSTSSEDFIQGIIDFLNKKFNVDEKMTYQKTNGKYYPKLEMTVEASKKFYKWVYQDFETFRLPDKYDRYIKLVG